MMIPFPSHLPAASHGRRCRSFRRSHRTRPHTWPTWPAPPPRICGQMTLMLSWRCVMGACMLCAGVYSSVFAVCWDRDVHARLGRSNYWLSHLTHAPVCTHRRAHTHTHTHTHTHRRLKSGRPPRMLWLISLLGSRRACAVARAARCVRASLAVC